MTTYTKAPRTLVPSLLPSESVFEVQGHGKPGMVVVAGSRGSWTAGRVMPSRTYPFGRPEQMGHGASRDEAVQAMP